MAAAGQVTCPCDACTGARLTIDQIFRVLDMYGWILDSYVVDFFEYNLWEKLPSSWRLSLRDACPQMFGTWLSGSGPCSRVWPLSLLALQQVIRIVQINRNHDDPTSLLACSRSKEVASRSNLTVENGSVADNLDAEYSRFTNLFSKHVKKKKRYEIEEIAQICANCACESGSKCIVDIGAGMGHLARVLAFRYGLCVACIEQNSSLCQQAGKCDQELLISVRKHVPDFCGKRPQHVSLKLESSSLVENELVNNLDELFRNSFSLNETETEFGLVGLHPCGDLAPLLLRLYASTREAKYICIVGCCYMKLTLGCNDHEMNGYPLSKHIEKTKYSMLSYTSREVACHAIEKYCDKLMTGNYDELIVHTYRAALETILVKKSPKLRHSQLRNVKVTDGMTFEQYCAAATKSFDQNTRPGDPDIHNDLIKSYLDRWKQVIMFGSLRMMLAPLIETVVLLDRFLFLSENNFAPRLQPVFDARLSPRNFVLISVKSNKAD